MNICVLNSYKPSSIWYECIWFRSPSHSTPTFKSNKFMFILSNFIVIVTICAFLLSLLLVPSLKWPVCTYICFYTGFLHHSESLLFFFFFFLYFVLFDASKNVFITFRSFCSCFGSCSCSSEKNYQYGMCCVLVRSACVRVAKETWEKVRMHSESLQRFS